MKYNFKNKKISKKGFTIIETLVAIFVLLVATTGPLTFAQSGLRSSFLARDQITAFYLAQDAVETLKNVRDRNTLYNRTASPKIDWLDNFGDCAPSSTLGESKACNLDDLGTTAVCALGAGCESMYFDFNSRKFYIDSGSNRTLSKYARTIYITELVEDREAQIIVKVKWDSNFFAEKRIIIQENIYNI